MIRLAGDQTAVVGQQDNKRKTHDDAWSASNSCLKMSPALNSDPHQLRASQNWESVEYQGHMKQ